MISYKIHLLRTGSTVNDPEKLYVGQSDVPLSGRGRKTLKQMAKELPYPLVEHVYTSPLVRCVQTAEILYPNYQPQLVEGLEDMNLGRFEGKSFDELRDDAYFTCWLEDSFNNTPPGGEKVLDFTQRTTAAFDGVVRQMMRDKVSDAAVVTHGGVIMALMAAIALPRLPIHQWASDNGSGYTLLTNTQMWLRDSCAEAFYLFPNEKDYPPTIS